MSGINSHSFLSEEVSTQGGTCFTVEGSELAQRTQTYRQAKTGSQNNTFPTWVGEWNQCITYESLNHFNDTPRYYCPNFQRNTRFGELRFQGAGLKPEPVHLLPMLLTCAAQLPLSGRSPSYQVLGTWKGSGWDFFSSLLALSSTLSSWLGVNTGLYGKHSHCEFRSWLSLLCQSHKAEKVKPLQHW